MVAQIYIRITSFEDSVMSMPKMYSDARALLKMHGKGVLRLIDVPMRESWQQASFNAIYLMLLWVDTCGGYPDYNRDANYRNIPDVNKICMDLKNDPRFNFKKLKDTIALLGKPSPFCADDADIENVKLFLNELINKLDEDIKTNVYNGFY